MSNEQKKHIRMSNRVTTVSVCELQMCEPFAVSVCECAFEIQMYSQNFNFRPTNMCVLMCVCMSCTSIFMRTN